MSHDGRMVDDSIIVKNRKPISELVEEIAGNAGTQTKDRLALPDTTDVIAFQRAARKRAKAQRKIIVRQPTIKSN